MKNRAFFDKINLLTIEQKEGEPIAIGYEEEETYTGLQEYIFAVQVHRYGFHTELFKGLKTLFTYDKLIKIISEDEIFRSLEIILL
jgi:hypothetical protein